MSVTTDSIADYLTRIRNAIRANHRKVDVPSSNLKREITRILVDEGYLRDYINVEDTKQGMIRIFLKVSRDGRPAISGLQRVSSPGLRQYVGVDKLPRVLNGLGLAIVSTSKGVMTDKRARKEKVGGEVLFKIW